MYGCDRQGFVDSFLKGKGQKLDTYFFPDWVPKDGIKEYNFDLAKAKSLLDAAKFDYSKPVRWLSWNKDARDRQSFIEDCQAKMKTIGVKIEITNGLDVTNKLAAPPATGTSSPTVATRSSIRTRSASSPPARQSARPPARTTPNSRTAASSSSSGAAPTTPTTATPSSTT